MKKTLIAGRGAVAQALATQLQSRGCKVRMFGSDESFRFDDLLSASDILFVAISSRDGGEASFRYMTKAVDAGKPVITCEKVGLANYWEYLKSAFPLLRYTATVGGGSRLLDLLRVPLLGQTSMEGVVNATLNFLFHSVQTGHSREQAFMGAQSLGLCEPGSNDFLTVINAEIHDALLKTAIAMNVLGVARSYVSASQFSYALVGEGGLQWLLERPRLRFVVRIARERVRLPEFGFSLQVGDWSILGSFVSIAETGFGGRFPKWHYNALYVSNEFSGSSIITGVGAGPIPTASVMVMDAREFGV